MATESKLFDLELDNLDICFSTAKGLGYTYVGLSIEMEGFEKPEVIINPIENFDKKLAYYKSAYDDGLNHKFAKGIKIVGFTCGNSYSDIEKDLIK